MGKKLPDELLASLNEFISSLMGLHFTESRIDDLERGIGLAAKDFGFEDEAAFVSWLRGTQLKKEHIERLASHLTVGETYFFRDSSSIDALEREILPELIESRKDSKRIRVWSAGCSTGEEAYTLAMLLGRLVPDIESWNISILATDINARALRKASEGVYTAWSFRETPGWVRDRYFRPAGEGTYRIDPAIQKMVSFGYLNLAEDIYPSLLNGTNGVDIIFCRNVIMYFSEAVARAVVKGLHDSLVDDGWLLVSPAEAVRSIKGLFAPVNLGGAIFYRKSAAQLEVTPQQELVLRPSAPLPPAQAAAEPRIEPAAPPEACPVAAQELVPREFLAEAAGFFAGGSYNEAVSLLESLTGEQRGEDGALLLARAYANMGRLEEAAKWCEGASAVNALNKASYMLLATIRQEQARGEEAVKNLKKALYLDQDFVIAHFMLGKLLMPGGAANEQAMRHLRTAHKLLERKEDDELLPESDGMMAGRLREIIASMLKGSIDG
ncbi:Chemotaxis protein methyltransferase [uncultured bacterium]|nr:Chemotaxis protein methyltransferase [uncultured bacterium]